MKTVLSSHLHKFLTCKLCWQFAILLFLVIFIAEFLMLIPFYYTFRNDHLTLFERNALQIAKVLTIDYQENNFAKLESDLLKYSDIKGGAIYDDSGNIVKKFGIDPKVSPVDFEGVTAINGMFYFKDQNHIYTLWNQQDLQMPFEVVAVLDSAPVKIIFTRFVQSYLFTAIILLCLTTIASLFISYQLLLKPIRKAYGFLQLAENDISNPTPHIKVLPNNELGFIFRVMNSTFSKLQSTLVSLNNLNDTLEEKVKERTKQLVKSEQENQFLQSHNPVTKLFNKYFFKLLLEERKKHSTLFGLLFLQINDYVAINQNLGHSIGDQFLAHIAHKLQHKITNEDLLGHFSQNTFAIATFNFVSIEELDSLALQFISFFSQPLLVESYSLHSSINIGIALYPTDNIDIEVLFQYADMALLQAHNAGVNTSQFYTHEINQQLSKNHQLYQDLHRAVVENQLSLVYQPQLSLHTHKIVGAETLIRWNHPVKGVIPPDEFIAILENSSLIFLITEWLFQTAATLHQELRLQGVGEFRFAVNLTAKQLNQDDLLTILRNIIEQHSLNPKFIEIEVTERVSLTNPEKYIDILKSIRSLGFQIAIDDFGSDYSSLKYLQKLPIDKIKIDKSFIDDMHKHNDNQKIVKAIIHLSKELNLKTLAEGVETIEQAELLTRLGCDEIQGYLISKPLDSTVFTEFCKQDFSFKFSGQNFGS